MKKSIKYKVGDFVILEDYACQKSCGKITKIDDGNYYLQFAPTEPAFPYQIRTEENQWGIVGKMTKREIKQVIENYTVMISGWSNKIAWMQGKID
jgi:hypothetical protein